MDKQQSKAAAADQDTGSAGDKGGLWRYEVPQQDPGAGAVQSNSAHYTGGAHGGDSQQGDFLQSPPEANAMPAGAPQTSRGSAGMGGADPQTAPVPGAGGGGGVGGAGEIASGGSGGSVGPGGGGDSGGSGGGGGGVEPAPVGNGTPDDPVWAT